MDFKQLQEEFRKLEEDAGREASSALLQIMELKMSDFKSYIDQKFTSIEERFSSIDQRFSSIQWMIGISFTFLSILMVILKFF
ncbi:MAG: hypothetical protein GDA51_01675 [Ekhidna sp.]|nr:hypothetical protein [Ekhidna sp.]MBC6425185.1 hypothetical protein [Ekhidna sp.]